MERFNLCRHLRCPHAYRQGCDRFGHPMQCPLARHAAITHNQCHLLADIAAPLDINLLREQLQAEVLSTARSQIRRQMQSECGIQSPMTWAPRAIERALQTLESSRD